MEPQLVATVREFTDPDRGAVELHATERQVQGILDRLQYAREYERWNEADDAQLSKRHRSGASVEELAAHFGRRPSAIRSHLRKLELG